MARHGENIHKRKDGRWEGRYIKGRSETGKAIWGYVYAYSYVDAKSALIRKKVKAADYTVPLGAQELTSVCFCFSMLIAGGFIARVSAIQIMADTFRNKA